VDAQLKQFAAQARQDVTVEEFEEKARDLSQTQALNAELLYQLTHELLLVLDHARASEAPNATPRTPKYDKDACIPQ
jgi:hypothetical protein